MVDREKQAYEQAQDRILSLVEGKVDKIDFIEIRHLLELLVEMATR